jgi:hypothetical protein
LVKGKVSSALMDYLNVTDICDGPECSLDLATPLRCSFSTEPDILNMELYFPNVNQNLTLVEADPFDFMVRTWNQTCRVMYNGPSTAVLASTGCPVAFNTPTTRVYELIYAATETCLPENQTTNAYFQVKQCRTIIPGDEKAFIQVKAHHGFLQRHRRRSASGLSQRGVHSTCRDKVHHQQPKLCGIYCERASAGESRPSVYSQD